ncbi:MAG: nucleotide exchange factor GrpE [Syntrophales bacterium]|nr:nucleotide exchange factor GrpE [Syntrophales bacterium]
MEKKEIVEKKEISSQDTTFEEKVSSLPEVKPYEGEELQEKLKQKEKEAAENYDKYLRALADLENYKKRSAREKAEVIKFGQENLIRDMLPVLDSLDRAIEQSEKTENFAAFKEGLKMVRSQMMSCLAKYGVEPIDCLNCYFDPNYHEALAQVESEHHEENEIVEEYQKGYLLNGRLLRPAKVAICKKRSSNNGACEEEKA